MRKIDTPDGLFHDGNSATGELGTILSAAWLNAVQEEFVSVVEAVIGPLDPNDNSQLLAAIKKLAWGGIGDARPSTLAGYGISDGVKKDPQGNVGIGVIPRAWGAQYPVVQQNAKTVYAADANSSYYGTNWYHTQGTHKKLGDGYSLVYQQDSSTGMHIWKSAVSGLAESIVEWTAAMTLDASTGILDVPAGITTKTPVAGDVSTKAATTEFVLGALFGSGQTWQSFAVGTQRLVGTTYYNATAKPIVIAIGWYMSTSALYYMHVQGVVAGEAGGNGAALVRGQLFVIVPSGAAYLLEQSTGSLAIEYWSELR